MSAAHTAGPWEPWGMFVRVEGAALDVACVVGYPDPEAEANARLIATAPDLLEAARDALSIAESWIHDQLDGTSSLDGALAELDSVRAAIRKATTAVEPNSVGIAKGDEPK